MTRIVLVTYLLSFLITGIHAQSPYPNLDFSENNFNHWNTYSGPQSGSGGARTFTHTPIITPNPRFAIIHPSAQPNDPNTCYNVSKIPKGKNYSIRVGPLSPGGYGTPQGYALSYSLTVDADRPIFIYQFCFVQQFDHGTAGGDPYGFGGGTGGTGPANNAQMSVRTVDGSGTEVGGVCGNYRLYPGVASNVSWFQWNSCGEVSNTPWITDVIDLSAHIGQTITIEFMTMDCYTGHHMAYSYISTSSATRDTVAYYCPGAPVTIAAPHGFKTYDWREIDGSFSLVKQNAAIIGQDLNGVNELTVSQPVAGTRYECTFTSYNGCSGTMIYELRPDSIHAVYSSILNNVACQRQDFSDLSTVLLPQRSSVSQWKWHFDDPLSGSHNTSDDQHPNHVFSNTGAYQVKLVVTSSTGCKDSVTQQIDILKQENADFLFHHEVCLYDTVHFTDASTASDPITQWEWDMGDGSVALYASSPHYRYSQHGTYPVTLKITTPQGCESSKTQLITVYPVPQASFQIPFPACVETDLHPAEGSSIASPGMITHWNWNFGDTPHSNTSQQAFHKYTHTGTYPISLVVTSDHGCTDTLEKVIHITPIPTAGFTIDHPTGCPPLCLQTTNQSNIPGGSIQSYQWKAGATLIGSAEELSWCLQRSGTESIQLTVTSDAGCQHSVQQQIEAYEMPYASYEISPQPATIADPVISFQNSSRGAIQYQWDFGDSSPAEYEYHTTHYYQYSGRYPSNLVIINEKGCRDSISHLVVIDSIYSVDVPNAFSPNGDGIHDVFNIRNIEFFPEAVLEIYNQWGELVFKSEPGYPVPWDGSRNGRALSASSYYYVLNIHKNGHEPLKGYITLLK